MAGRRGSEAAAAEGGVVENFAAGEKLLQCLTNPNLGLISVHGFKGVGRWSIAKYAARKSKDSHLFDGQILVELLGKNFSLGKAQKEIARQLGMMTTKDGDSDDEEESIDTKVATKIYKSLIGRKFLLVLGDVSPGTNLEFIGDPYLRKLKDYKIVLVSTEDLQSDMAIKLEDLSRDVLREEADDIARSPGIRGYFTPNVVLDCFLYMLVFKKSKVEVEKLKWHWRAEGFIITEEEEEEDLIMFNKMEALLTVLQLRSMVERDGNYVKVADSISRKAEALVTSTDSRFWIKSPYIPSEDDKVEDIQWLVAKHVDEITSNSFPKCPKLSTLLLCGFVFWLSITDNFFEQIKGLRLLKLKWLENKYLPKSVSCLHNLKILKLERCRHLQTLLISFPIFDKLEFLQLEGEKNDSSQSISDDVFQHMKTLRYLYLKRMEIRSLPSSISMLQNLHHLKFINCNYLIRIPDELFGHLRQLCILELRSNDKLESLPSSLSKLVNLKKLILHSCSSLNSRLLPHLQNLSALEELDLNNCLSLLDLGDITSPSLGDILPNLRKFYICNVGAVQRLSLEGCQSLESVSLSKLTSLEVLDLSGTKLKTLPQDMSDARLLRRLDMLHMNQIRKINWNDLSITLEELNFSDCGTLNSSNDVKPPGERGGARIRVSNSKLLQSFHPTSKLWESKCFTRFHIYLSPCKVRDKPIRLQRRLFIYKDIDSTVQTHDLPCPASHLDRCLEIHGGHRSPNGIHGVLSHLEILILCDNAFVQRLSDLGDVNKMNEVKECRVERCKHMEMFFEGDNSSSNCLSHLEKISMSNLARLRSVCEGTYRSRSFTLLKHIQLECCPRLVTVFSSSVFLECLEMLKIKYCSRLEAVFGGDAAAKGSLHRLHTVCLWELRRLESICHGTHLPALKKLKVRGCWMLKKLPLRFGGKAAASTSTGGGRVEVEGESEWWEHLELEDKRIQHLINFKKQRPFR